MRTDELRQILKLFTVSVFCVMHHSQAWPVLEGQIQGQYESRSHVGYTCRL